MRNYHKIILPFLGILVLQSLYSILQAQITTFQKIYPTSVNQSTRDVLPTPDGGYLIAAMTENQIPGDSDINLVKTDNIGTILWTKTYGGSQPDYPHCLLATSDGNYFILGFTASTGAGMHDIWLLKIDPSGNILWTKTYGGTGDDSGHEIILTSDGNYMIVGHINSDACLMKIDPAGAVIWTQTYGGPNYETGGSVKQCLDGGYIFVGQTYSYGNGGGDIWLVKTDAGGISQWTKTFGGSAFDEGKFVLANSDGSYTLCANDSSSGHGDLDVQVINTDASGNVNWNKTYGGVKKDICKMIQHTSDGGYIVIGASRSFGWINPDMWLVKLDAAGDTLWTKHFGSWYHDHGYSVKQTSDGGYIAVGHNEDINSITQMMFVKLDANGNVLASVEEFAVNNLLGIYPNPTNGNFTLDLSQLAGQKTETTITNCLGQIIDKRTDKSSSKINLDLSAEEKGIYFIEIKAEDQSISRGKIVLQ